MSRYSWLHLVYDVNLLLMVPHVGTHVCTISDGSNHHFRLVGWLGGWLVGLLVGWWVGWLVGGLVGWLVKGLTAVAVVHRHNQLYQQISEITLFDV